MKAEKALTVIVDSENSFHSPTWGSLSYGRVLERLINYIGAEDKHRYRIIVGTDSAPKNGESSEFITALIVHRIGHGGIYFWQRIVAPQVKSLRERIYREALFSLDFAKILVDSLVEANLLDLDLEIHVDVGKVGETREIINEVVGMVRGNGFEVKTKPDSFGASKVADRHT